MKAGILIAVALIIVVLGIGIYFVSNINSPTSTSDNGVVSNPDTETSVEDSGNNIEVTETKNIEIKGFAFSSATLTISKGDTVKWTNMDSVRHTVTSDSEGELDSMLLSQGQSYSHAFNEAGTYSYHCTPHPNMKGKIIVQ